MYWDMQHVLGHTACTGTCSTDWDVQHVLRHAACTWTSSMDWIRTCSMDMDMQHGCEHGHAAFTCPCCMSMLMSMLHVHVPAGCLRPSSMSKSIPQVQVYVSISMLHVHVHAACSSPCSTLEVLVEIHLFCIGYKPANFLFVC
jgi:hypothetical protein